VYVWNHIVWCY